MALLTVPVLYIAIIKPEDKKGLVVKTNNRKHHEN
jgi:hypothetical protein